MWLQDAAPDCGTCDASAQRHRISDELPRVRLKLAVNQREFDSCELPHLTRVLCGQPVTDRFRYGLQERLLQRVDTFTYSLGGRAIRRGLKPRQLFRAHCGSRQVPCPLEVLSA